MTDKIKRRNFISKSAMGAAAGMAAALPYNQTGSAGIEKLFIHHVFFWLKKPVSDQAKAKFEKALKQLATIETVVDHHLGIPAPTNRDLIDTTYSYSLLLAFRNKSDQDVYQTHPTHLKFINDCQELWERVVVYDTISF